MDELNPTRKSGAKAFFLCGTVLILSGAEFFYIFCLIASESFIKASLSRDEAHNVLTNYVHTALLITAFVTAGFAVSGFFVSKLSGYPLPYLIFTGLVPGYLFLAGWRAIRSGFVEKKGLQAYGSRFRPGWPALHVVIITTFVGLLDVVVLFSILKGLSDG